MANNKIYDNMVREIMQLAQKRMAVYPARDESRSQFMKVVESLADHLRRNVDWDGFRPREDILQLAEQFAGNPVFICGAMKSGTTLMGQLLDGHPDLLVMPGDSHYADEMDRWERGAFEAISTAWIRKVISPTGKEPFFFLGSERDSMERFLQYLAHYLRHSKKEIFVCAVLAVYACVSLTSGVTGRKYWVEKTPQNELKAALLARHFPGAKFIHVLRDPLDNIASLNRLFSIRKWSTSTVQQASSLKRLFRAARRNLDLYGKHRYHIVRYEDLVAAPENELRGICDFLGVPFHAVLLTPTENGRPSLSNSMFSERRIKGEILRNHETRGGCKHHSPGDMDSIVTELYEEATGFGYKWDAPEIVGHRKWRLGLRVRNVVKQLGKDGTPHG